jgi:hypothetical protein
MDELEIEKKQGISWDYLADIPAKRKEIGDKYQFNGWGLGAVQFSYLAKAVIEELGPEKGEVLIKKAVEEYGRARGRRIAEVVKGLGKPLSLKNFLIYADMDTQSFKSRADIVDNDLEIKWGKCDHWDTALEFGVGDYWKFSCKYLDDAIQEGYNPETKVIKETRHDSGKNHCMLRYVTRDSNKTSVA